MACEWVAAPLDELVDDIIDRRGVTPLKLGSDFVPVGYRVISAKTIKNRRVDLASDVARFVDASTYRRWMKTPLRADDVLLTSEAPLGEPAYIPNDVEWCLGQRLFAIRPNSRRLHGRFLFYALQSDAVRNDLLSRATGTTAQGIRQTELRRVHIPLPEVNEQRGIAHILGTLDDKIELNRRMSATLEAMARALFKSWFVDFDPVRAKAEGRDTGLPDHLAALFPNRLVDSELGEAPEGWKVKPIGAEYAAVKGVSYKGRGLADSGTPLHNLNSICEGGGYKYEGIKHYTGEYRERHVVVPGDVIVANTEQGHDRLLIGYAALVPRLFGKGIASHHIYRMRPKPDGTLTSVFLYHLLNSPRMHDVVSGYANGTTVNMLTSDGVEQPLMVVPPRPLVDFFSAIALNCEQRREELITESRTLAALRDALLPKLISGELRIPDAKKFVTAVDA